MKRHILIASTLLLGACSTQGLLTSTEPQQTIYALRAGTAEPVAPNGAARVIEVLPPSLPPGFGTDRVALYSEGGHKLDYFAGARWADTLDAVIQDFTRRTLTETLPYAVAVAGAQRIGADYRLQVKLNEFQPVYDGGITETPQLRVAAEFTLVALPEERIVRNFTLSKAAPAQSNRLDEITSGLENLLRMVEREAFTRVDSAVRSPGSAAAR